MNANNHDRVAVIDACRTPFMRSGTAFYDLMAWELGRCAVKGLIVRTGIEPSLIDYVIMGTVMADVSTTNVAQGDNAGGGTSRNNTRSYLHGGLCFSEHRCYLRLRYD